MVKVILGSFLLLSSLGFWAKEIRLEAVVENVCSLEIMDVSK